MRPFSVSTSRRLRRSMRVTGVASETGTTDPSLRQQRAETLAAKRIDVALGGFREVIGRDFAQFLAATVGAEHEFDRRPPIAQVLGQSIVAIDVGLAARGLSDRAVASAPASRDIPPARLRARCAGRRAAAGRSAPDRFRDPISARASLSGLSSGMWIQCAPRSYGTPKILGVGDAAPADPIGGLDQRKAAGRRRRCGARRRCRRRPRRQ